MIIAVIFLNVYFKSEALVDISITLITTLITAEGSHYDLHFASRRWKFSKVKQPVKSRRQDSNLLCHVTSSGDESILRLESTQVIMSSSFITSVWGAAKDSVMEIWTLRVSIKCRKKPVLTSPLPGNLCF